MPAYKDGKYVSVPCDGRVVAALERRAADEAVSLAVAALGFINDGIGGVIAAPASPDADAMASIASLESVPFEWLTAEIERRLDGVAAIEARATAAEALVAKAAALLGGGSEPVHHLDGAGR